MNKKRMEKLFWAHPSKRKDYVTIYFRITINGRRAELGSTGIQIHRKHWNCEAQRITARTQEAQQQNNTLEIWKARVTAIFNDLLMKGEPFTVNHVKKLFKQNGRGHTYLQVFDMYLLQIQKDPNISSGTRETYAVIRKRIAEWLKEKKMEDLPAESFTLGIMEQYRTYMKIDLRRSASTIRKHTQTAKQVLSWAFLNDYIVRDPLQGYRVSREKPNAPTFLTPNELVKLLQYEFQPNEHVLAEVRDQFVIMCFTGFAYADLKTFSSGHLVYKTMEYQEPDQHTLWIEKDRVKTDKTARQPLHPVVKWILDSRYQGLPERLRVRPNQKTNLYLKVIALRLKISKKLTTHIGRKTFANLCLNGGLYSDLFAAFAPDGLQYQNTLLSTEATIAMMGRTSAKGLEAYAKPDERRIIMELKKAA